jgi:hypothetical protein
VKTDVMGNYIGDITRRVKRKTESTVIVRQEINLCIFGLTEDHISCWDLCLVGHLTMQYLDSCFFSLVLPVKLQSLQFLHEYFRT